MRSATTFRVLIALLALGLAAAPAAPAAEAPQPAPARVVLVLVNQGGGVEELAATFPGMSPGGLSPGLSSVRPSQTYLDISQGNRVFTSLYPEKLPDALAVGGDVPHWQAIVDRAEGAPANIVPGLLGGTLKDAGIPIHVDPSLRTPAVIAAERDGHVSRGAPGQCETGPCPPGFDVVYANRVELREIAAGLDLKSSDDLLIAIERPPPPVRELLAMGIRGRGFDGELTSSTTRSPGLVTTTDLGPTILERFGIAAPKEMSGEPITTKGSRDAAAVAKRSHRLSVITKRRDPVIFGNVLLWLFAALAAIAISRGAAARVALPLLALSYVYLPLLLMFTAALDPSRVAERVVVGLGAPLLALLTWRFVRGYAALALACGLSVGAYALDVILGSPLTTLSLMGSNPAIGVRFFGIGNELEGTVAVLVPVGVGAVLTALRAGELEQGGGRAAAIAFLGVGAVAAVIFGLGRFGADVGAVIVLPVGAAAAAAIATGATRSRRTLLFVVGAPALALILLAGLDLAFGGGAHLTSSVLESGGSSDLGDVFSRRLRLTGKSFGKNADSVYLYLAVIAAVLAVVKRDTVIGWFSGRRAAMAGVGGAAFATAVGTLANDSGALVLMIGTAYVLAATAFVWAQGPPPDSR